LIRVTISLQFFFLIFDIVLRGRLRLLRLFDTYRLSLNFWTRIGRGDGIVNSCGIYVCSSSRLNRSFVIISTLVYLRRW
jgi:hypothetical protein